ncbi:MAG: hypothetical protein HC822_19140 [Oscillochloris sp.]|nr:hypothetical protein [Oscillochloris sp.]
MRGADLRGSTISGLQAELRDLQGAIVAPLQAIDITALFGLDVQPDEL